MDMQARNWFITGISRGLGRALAQAALARGDRVVGTTRSGASDLPHSERLQVLALDMGDPEQIPDAVAQAFAAFGHLDVVVNNAGYGLLGAVEETDTPEAYELFMTNFFGPFHLLQAALPRLRAQARGHVVNVTSIAAIAPQAGSGLYAASKAALEALSESLAAEVAPLGLRVSLVEPGAFRTDFLSAQSLRYTARSHEAYDDSSGRVLERLRQMAGRQPGDPEAAARAILRLVDAPEPPLRLLLGSDAVQRTRAKLRQLDAGLAAWEALSLSTDHADGAMSPLAAAKNCPKEKRAA